MKIYLAADHAGYVLKEKVKIWLEKNGYEVKDFGAFKLDPADDYPDFMMPAAEAVSECEQSSPSTGSGQKKCFGIFFGGSGQGEAMVANRHKGVRAAVLYKFDEDIIRLSREHNDANILCLGARFLKEKEALKALEIWLKTPFSIELRHKRRIDKF